MNRSLRMLCAVAALFVARGAFAQSTEEEAGDTSEVDKDALGPLRERIRPVSGHLFLKKGRFELSPSASVTLRDPFFTKYIFGGSISFFPLENFGITVHGGYSIPTVAGTAQICVTQPTDPNEPRSCRAPDYKTELDGRAPGQIRLLGSADLEWSPIYGKLSLFAEKFLHFDLYGVGGVAAVQYAGPTADPSGFGSAPYLAIGGEAGVGMRIFLNRWLCIRGEFRDVIYSERIAPLRPETYSVRNQILFELGLSLFFPTGFGES